MQQSPSPHASDAPCMCWYFGRTRRGTQMFVAGWRFMTSMIYVQQHQADR